PWVVEGVAGLGPEMMTTAPGRQPITLPEAEFLSLAKKEELWPYFADAVQKNWRFSYTADIYFWYQQVERSGEPAFLGFERACFSDPQACRSIFFDFYGTDLRTAVDDFQAEVRSGRIVPPQRTVF